MLVVLRFAVESEAEFLPGARAALAALAAQPGYRSGWLGRGYDEPDTWCLVLRWESVGSYRRALSSHQVRTAATPLLARAVPEASAFEPLAWAEPGGPVRVADSDLAGADRAGADRAAVDRAAVDLAGADTGVGRPAAWIRSSP